MNNRVNALEAARPLLHHPMLILRQTQGLPELSGNDLERGGKKVGEDHGYLTDVGDAPT